MDDEELLNSAQRIVYKQTPQGEIALFVLRPKAINRTLPAVIYFTGGGWREGLPQHMIANAAWFRDRGIIGIAADYRVKSRHGTSPIECVKDAKSAVRFVRTNASQLGIDPDRIIAAGGSAAVFFCRLRGI